MKRNSSVVSGGAGDLSQFSKNRFFTGKLMTPQVMQEERSYNSRRLETLTRFVVGNGLLHGLEVESVSQDGDGIEVTVGAGLAIDGSGRPIVVDTVTTNTLPDVDGDELYLYIQYDEVGAETVPVPDADGGVADEAVPNRTIETFELTHTESPPENQYEGPSIDAADLLSADGDADQYGGEVAKLYHDRHRTGPADVTEPAVYLGAFERDHDGSWVEMTEAPSRSYVYDHDMLFGLLVEHLADTDNPHRTETHEPVDPVPDDLEALNERVTSMEHTIEGLQRERDLFQQYAVRKTINDRARFFESLGDRLEQRSGKGSRLAREVARRSTEAPASGDRLEREYREQLSGLLDTLVRIGDALEGVVPEESLERYLVSVSELQSTLDSDASLLEVVDADDRVSETADSLDVLVDVVPDA